MLGTKGEGRAEAARKKTRVFLEVQTLNLGAKKSFAFPLPFPREIHALTALLHQ